MTVWLLCFPLVDAAHSMVSRVCFEGMSDGFGHAATTSLRNEAEVRTLRFVRAWTDVLLVFSSSDQAELVLALVEHIMKVAEKARQCCCFEQVPFIDGIQDLQLSLPSLCFAAQGECVG